MPGLAVGVDGGASKTVAVVADSRGQVLGAGRAGNADIYQSPHAVAEVASAIAAALGEAGASHPDVGGAALSLVGADWPEDMADWRASLGILGLGHLAPGRALVVNDALGALAAGAPEGPAVTIVVGTGCAVGARGPSGETWHSSFWQRTQGGGELAERALDAVFVAHLGIGPATGLAALALDHFGARDVADLLHGFTARGRSWPCSRASFAPHVLDAAEGGDPVARAVALAHAEAVALYGRAAIARVGIRDEARLVLAGGVLRHRSRLTADLLVARMREAVPGLVVTERPPEPVAGAVLLALGSMGTDTGRTLRERLVATLPSPDFFHTGVRAA